jgi:FkbM family methyltransferase
MRLLGVAEVLSHFGTTRILVRLGRSGDDLQLVYAEDPAGATHQIVNVFGRPFLTHLTEQDHVISGALVRDGFWEHAESMLLLSNVRSGMTIFDVGANIGYYSILLGRVLGKDGAIFAFEPEPRNFEILRANAALARSIDVNFARLEVHCKAVADQCGTAQLKVFDKNFGLHSLEVNDPRTVASIAVETVTIDDLHGFGKSPAVVPSAIALIKADIQGGELKLLRGAEQTLAADRPLLCLELEPYLTGKEACIALLDWLLARGYGQFRLFHSNRAAPPQCLAELSCTMTRDEAVSRIETGKVGAYGTVFACYDCVSPKSRE